MFPFSLKLCVILIILISALTVEQAEASRVVALGRKNGTNIYTRKATRNINTRKKTRNINTRTTTRKTTTEKKHVTVSRNDSWKEQEGQVESSLLAERVVPGCVVYRNRQGSNQYLLLQSAFGSNPWVSPKGYRRFGHRHIEHAALLVLESHTGILKSDIRVIPDYVKQSHCIIRSNQRTTFYYLAELINQDMEIRLSNEFVDYKWVSLADACEAVKHQDQRDLLLACYEHLKYLKGKYK